MARRLCSPERVIPARERMQGVRAAGWPGAPGGGAGGAPKTERSSRPLLRAGVRNALCKGQPGGSAGRAGLARARTRVVQRHDGSAWPPGPTPTARGHGGPDAGDIWPTATAPRRASARPHGTRPRSRAGTHPWSLTRGNEKERDRGRPGGLHAPGHTQLRLRAVTPPVRCIPSLASPARFLQFRDE